MNNRLSRFCAVVAILSANLLIPACDKPGDEVSTVEKVAMYEGQDRRERLLAGAKKEGSLSLYTSLAATTLEEFTADFEEKYGIKVNAWRAGDDKVLQRALTETKAGRFDVDVVHVVSVEMEALHREKLLQEVKSLHHKDLLPHAIPPHREWVATVLNVIVQAYNTDKVKEKPLPKTYEDLLDRKWRGRLGFEAKDQEWFFTVVKDMGEEKGLKYFKDLVARNGLSVRSGHSLLNNLVVSGEVPLALTAYVHMAEQAKEKGAPIDWFAIEPAIAVPIGVGVSKKAPHPNAAVLFYDYMISEGQAVRVKRRYVPTNRKYPSPLKNVQIKLIDPAAVLDENEKWVKLYDDIILKRSGQ